MARLGTMAIVVGSGVDSGGYGHWGYRCHRDPFDRLLIAQAMVLDIPIMTADPAFDPYAIEVIPS